MDEKNKRTPWTDVSFIWKKIAGVIAAVGVLATLTVNIFKTPADITYTLFAFLGFILLMISWYVDKQASYTHDEILKYEKAARDDFTKAIYETRDTIKANKEDSDGKINMFEEHLDKLMKISEDTRKDTLRIQLMMLIKDQPDNTDSILKVAEVYFLELDGDWYMTSEFKKWANAHNIEVPDILWAKVRDRDKN